MFFSVLFFNSVNDQATLDENERPILGRHNVNVLLYICEELFKKMKLYVT